MKVITLCGSTRFKSQFEEMNESLTRAGHIVLSVGFFEKAEAKLVSAEELDTFRRIHFKKIDMADEIFVIDVNEYVGESTRDEIEYATRSGKKVHYYSEWKEAERSQKNRSKAASIEIQPTRDPFILSEINKEVHQLHETWHPERFKSYNRADTVTFFKQMMATSVMTFFLAVQAGKPLGYLWFEQRAYHENSFKQSFASLYVHQICVKEGVKQQGVGKMLMQEVEQLAIRDGIDRIELDVWVKNESARAFYEALGYEPIRQVMSKTMNN